MMNVNDQIQIHTEKIWIFSLGLDANALYDNIVFNEVSKNR